jgi:hypothetical protein
MRTNSVVSDIALSLMLSSLSWIVHTLLWASVTLHHTSAIPSLLQLTCNFSSVLIVCCWFLTWVALDDVHLCFSLMLIRKPNAVEEEGTWAASFYYSIIHTHDWWHDSYISFYLPPAEGSVAMDHLFQIVLNWKLCKFKKWCEFASDIKVKSCKKKSYKTRPARTDLIYPWLGTNVHVHSTS